MTHPLVGIDLGTTNSCLAVYEDQRPRVIPNAEGGRTTPSVVSFGPEVLVGSPAQRFAPLQPQATVSSVKRLIGRRFSELGRINLPYKVQPGPDDSIRLNINGQAISPEEVAGRILNKLLDDARAFLGQEISEIVLALPAHFDDAQRQATAAAAALAGVSVSRLLNEPTAASLAYGRGKEDQTLAVFDLGGGTFDISILEVGQGVFEVLGTDGDIDLGGDDFDRLLIDWLIGEWQEEHGEELILSPEVEARVAGAAQTAKHELSGLEETVVSLPFLLGTQSLETTISRERFEDLSRPLLQRMEVTLREVLSETTTEIDEVLLVGGMTRMPAVQRMVEGVIGSRPRGDVQPDEAVAMGASIQAASIRGQDSSLLLDVTPLALGIETEGRVMRRLIEANTTVPAIQSEIFSTSEDNQPTVEIRILQGEHARAEENRRLGEIRLIGIPPAIAGVPQIEVSFLLDADGILQVTARDLATGQVQELRIEGTASLGSEEIASLKIEGDQALMDLQERALRLAEARKRRLLDLLGQLMPRVDDRLKQRLAGALNDLQQSESGPGLPEIVDQAEREITRAIHSGQLGLRLGG
jgi:molecular chaperone DnaK